VSLDAAKRDLTTVTAAIEDKVRQPNVAPQGQREVEMPNLPKGSPRKAMYKKKVEARNEGVGAKGEPLSDKELQKAATRVKKGVLRCLRRHGERNRAYPRVPVSVTVTPAGKVTKAVLDEEIGTGKLATCVEKAVKKMRLRGPRPGVEVRNVFFGFGAIRKPKRRPAKGRTLPKTKYNGDQAL